jgi:hypothetical protein
MYPGMSASCENVRSQDLVYATSFQDVRDMSRKEQPQILRLRLAEKPAKLRSG